MSVWAKKWAYEQRVGNSGAKAVLVALAEFADESGFCYPSQSTLSQMTEIAERTVRAHLAFLEDNHIIKRQPRRGEHGHWTSDGHTLLAPPEALRPPTQNGNQRQNPPHVQRQDSPAAESANGKNPHHGRPNLPAAKSAAKPSVESDEPSIEPSEIDIEARVDSVLIDYSRTVGRDLETLHYQTKRSWRLLIQNRLQEGWDERKLHEIFVGCSKDDWPQRKKYNSITDLLTKIETMDRMINLAGVADEIRGNGNGNKNQPTGKQPITRDYSKFPPRTG